METMEEPSGEQEMNLRCGMVAVVGAANAGKSSLINRLMGEKISIVSPVAQTTRNQIRAIHTEERGQVVFLDTPGVHQAKKPLNQQMNKMARASIEGVDVLMLVVDRSEKPALEVDGWIRKVLKEDGVPAILVMNKCDREDRASEALKTLWAQLQEEKGKERPLTWVTVSAETGKGCDALLEDLFQRMPPGPLLFPEDMASDFPRKLVMADIIREKFFHRLHQELPHSVAVWIEHLNETEKEWKVSAVVYVRAQSQKGIVIGKKGRLIKAVKGEAATDIAEAYGQRIRLELNVKVEKDWDKNFWMLKKLGYVS